ncbi:Rrf2 family transcriptional regulator [Ramlibacter sp. USB13]|uniref:Rrf2 family transcriptional regulator n=1 Tax=Ramlibacter cellulosilyticus TaxID=2764187 RepID=A0A923SBE6_9BURK|nr:Rrf2 family transcriptional regulator [Ramlibacter cellulosilyticus]MBC5783103.1 Rrf2 family transcriptional regulator [Ramlibacter cellulosilyticus]
MKLTAFTDYSLRALIYLATDPDQRATIAQIATAYAISEHHLVKVVHFLGQQGWLHNVRGKGGGMELALPPERIVLGQVVRATEGQAVVAECFGSDGCDCCIAPNCRLRGVLQEAVTAFEAVLDRYTLADLVSNRQQLAQVLFVEPARGQRAAKGA